MSKEKYKTIAESLRSNLLDFHLEFLAALKRNQESTAGRALSAGEWFQMLISAPEYKWLKPFNSSVSDLDALVAGATVSEQDALILRHRMDAILSDASVLATARASTALQSLYDAVAAIAKDLPQGELPANSEEITKQWHTRLSKFRH